MSTVQKITCATACNKIKSSYLPFNWDLNIYRGCEHGCKYCYALYSHGYADLGNFYADIYVKTNIVERLEEQLKKSSWKGEVLNIGGVTDSYQPLEKDLQFMPEILKLLIKYKNPCIISTKSDLILRDYNLIEELADITYVNIAATVTTVDQSVANKLEPGAVSSKKRIEMLKEFSKTKASIGLHCMPIVPYLTDSQENLDGIFRASNYCNANYTLTQVLNLRGRTKDVFLDFIYREYNHLYKAYLELYKFSSVEKQYKAELYKTVNKYRAKYKVSASYDAPMKRILARTEHEQLSLF